MQMKKPLSSFLLLLLAAIGFAASAQPPGFLRGNDVQGKEMRVSIEVHRVARRGEVRREEALAGRRLTAEERAELREQLRRQWAAQGETAQTAQSQPVQRLMPSSALPGTQ